MRKKHQGEEERKFKNTCATPFVTPQKKFFFGSSSSRRENCKGLKVRGRGVGECQQKINVVDFGIKKR